MMAHWETGSGRINDLRGFSDACERHGVMGLIDAVSSLGVADFAIDDFPGAGDPRPAIGGDVAQNFLEGADAMGLANQVAVQRNAHHGA